MNLFYSIPSYCFHDRIGETADKITGQWLLQVVEANPGILEMLKDRENTPYRDLLPWSGEFIGKHLTASAEVYMLTGDLRLKRHLTELIKELYDIQAPDGYIGPWPRRFQLTGQSPNSRYTWGKEEEIIPNWDIWDFYHLMYGLICCYRAAEKDAEEWKTEVRDMTIREAAVKICEKLAELLEKTFFKKGIPLSGVGTPETNLAVIHSLTLLYGVTHKAAYKRMAEQILLEFELDGSVDYFRLALQGKDYWQMPIPRWEGLHCIMGLGALYEATGREDYRDALEKLWLSMRRTDRHNTGGFTSGEAACGNPYDGRAIETCCTTAWMALSVMLLRLIKNPEIADELELSLFNGGLGAISPSGRFCTYNTPMKGYRNPSYQDIAFQIRPGTPELNCCSVNAPRIVGLVSQWACVPAQEGIYINYYGSYETEFIRKGKKVRIIQESNYPVEGTVRIRLETELEEELTLYLRIPHWSEQTSVGLKKGSDETISEIVQGGTYIPVTQVWNKEMELNAGFTMSLHFWKGEREEEGHSSVYYGPILLTYDEAFNNRKGRDISLHESSLRSGKPRDGGKDAWLLLDAADNEGEKVTLCDFRSAGYKGRPYETWLNIVHED